MCQTFVRIGLLNVVNRTPSVTEANFYDSDTEYIMEESCWKATATAINNIPPGLVLCILPSSSHTPVYSGIKNVADTVIGVPKQCVQYKYVSAGAKKHYFVNLCLKINLKLGGVNSYLAAPQVPCVSERPTMIIGATVNRSAGSLMMEDESVNALSASKNISSREFASVVRAQSDYCTEVILDLKSMIKEVLKNFHKACGEKPERILFYRHCVSYGQMDRVLRDEVAAIKNACSSLEENYSPSLTFVIVRKTRKVRLFSIDTPGSFTTTSFTNTTISTTSDEKTDTTTVITISVAKTTVLKNSNSTPSGNCPPGTIVDADIVRPNTNEFYF